MLVSSSAFAADIDLGEGYHVPQNFSSVLIASSDGTAIQNAVNNIQSGGTIFLSGNFLLTKTINIKKNLSIKGLENAVLHRVTSNDRVIRCQGDITLESLDISGGWSTNGGGIKIDGGTVIMTNCKIHDNVAVLGGGGIHSQAKTLTLTSCDISNNLVLFAGGGISFIGGTVTIDDCNISNNESSQLYGGGIGASGTTITMNNSKITGNTAKTNGGGFYISVKTVLTATSCDISGNQPEDYYVDNGSTYNAE